MCQLHGALQHLLFLITEKVMLTESQLGCDDSTIDYVYSYTKLSGTIAVSSLLISYPIRDAQMAPMHIKLHMAPTLFSRALYLIDIDFQ